MNNKTDERRTFFRIEDKAIVKLTKLDAKAYENAYKNLKTQSVDNFTLGSALAALEQDYQTVFSKIKRNHPEITLYLELLNKKIELISEYILKSDPLIENTEPTDVNISASGIAIQNTDNLAVNDLIEIKLVLLPHKTAITAYGIVTRIKQHNDTGILCIDFEHIKESDQELIIKHNMNKQLEEARTKLQS